MQHEKQPAAAKKHLAARLWTEAKNFFGLGGRSKADLGLLASLEAKYTVGGAASHTESKQLVALIHPGAYVVLTPKNRPGEAKD